MNICSLQPGVWYNHILINYQFVTSVPFFFCVPSPFMWACSPNDSFEIDMIFKKNFTNPENNLMLHKNNAYFRALLPQFHYYTLSWKLYKRYIHFLGEKIYNLHKFTLSKMPCLFPGHEFGPQKTLSKVCMPHNLWYSYTLHNSTILPLYSVRFSSQDSSKFHPKDSDTVVVTSLFTGKIVHRGWNVLPLARRVLLEV